MKDFRDPKVSWDESSNSWLMTIAKPLEYKIAFFNSPDLKYWKHLSDFGPFGATGGCWECPDLFQLPTPSGDSKWVLLVSLNPGGITGGSGTQYFIGDWDGKKFSTDQRSTKWIDYGRDNYAGVTFFNAPEQRRIFIGWMSNWDYAFKLPSPLWRGSMTAPRELKIIQSNSQLLLSSLPITELQTSNDHTFEIDGNHDCIITITDRDLELVINYDSKSKRVTVDRSNAWLPDLEDVVQVLPAIDYETFSLRLLLDHGSLELFILEAGLALTTLHTLPASSVILQKTEKQLQ
jgi:sucrose-6-phosphate hydrolase SacC (GH32 family)